MRIVRKMQPQDMAAVIDMEKVTFADPWSEQAIGDTANQSHAYILVALQDEEVVGYCIAYQILDEAEIARIAVKDTFRKQGVGRSLLDAVLAESRAKGGRRVLLDVRESNLTARTFYRNYGFCEDGIRKNYYEMPKEDAVLMSMEAVSTSNANR